MAKKINVKKLLAFKSIEDRKSDLNKKFLNSKSMTIPEYNKKKEILNKEHEALMKKLKRK